MTDGTISWLIDRTLNHPRHEERVSKWSSEHRRSTLAAWAWWEKFAKKEGKADVPLSDPFWSGATLTDALAAPKLKPKTSTRRIYLSAFRLLARTAIIEGIITHSPADAIYLPTPKPMFFSYSDDDVAALLDACSVLGTKRERTAMPRLLALMADLGQRQGDCLAMTYGAHYRDGTFTFQQSKTQRGLQIPATDRLLDLLGPGTDRIGKIVNWPGGETRLLNSFAKVRDAAGLPKEAKMMHLRHYAVLRMARLGFNALQISTITGHTVKSAENMLQKHYFARDSEVAADVIRKINAAG